MNKSKMTTRIKRKSRSRLFGKTQKPRVAVYRTAKHMFVQFIDDDKQITILGKNDRDFQKEKNKITRAQEFGKYLAAEALKTKITTVIFDRSGYTYHGRIKALADGLRAGGLKF